MYKYALEKIKKQIISLIGQTVGISINESDIGASPSHIEADLALPLFKISQRKGMNVRDLADEVIKKTNLKNTAFSKIDFQGGFLNFSFDYKQFNPLVLKDFQKFGKKYGSSRMGRHKKIVIDYSSPNVAKPFSVGHLRSTIIGQALYNIFSFLGYKVIGDNHIGDWGTQFGKLMYAYKQWGNRKLIDQNPIKELLRLYVKFHEKAEKNPEIEDESRLWFKKLENKDQEVVKLWKWFVKVSWCEFKKIYNLLGVKFDYVLGESFYNNKLQDVVKEIFDKGLGNWEEVPTEGVKRAGIIPGENELQIAHDNFKKVALVWLDKYGIKTPLLIQKSDGTSLYATRDLATAKYRIKKWHPIKILYVVGNEQEFYFRQWFKVLELMGLQTPCIHVGFGLVRLSEGKMSTRKGRVIFLEELLNKAIERAGRIIQDRQLSSFEKETIAKIIGIGAVKYTDLSQNRMHDIIFDWDKMLNMHGDSAPYLQYAYVRIQSILRKTSKLNMSRVDGAFLQTAEEIALIKAIARFPEIIQAAAVDYYPHFVADYLFQLSQAFSIFYTKVSVLKAETKILSNSRLYLCQMTAQVIKTGLGLLGINVPEKM